MQTLIEVYEHDKERILNELMTFLRFPSVSSEEKHRDDMLACSAWLEEYLQAIGMHVERWKSSQHPIVFASHLEAGPDKPTLLLYNHYDVQPVDPLDLWKTPPFEPTIREGNVYARGASDNKGQCFYAIQAIKMLLQRDGTLPINLKMVIDGGEEVGSSGLAEILASKKEQLRADYLAVLDVGILKPDIPAVTLGTRGLITLTLEVQGPSSDLHSGSHGGLVNNPLHALTTMLAMLHTPEGKVAIPGFYDDVADLSSQERQQLDFSFDTEAYRSEFGVLPYGGEKGVPPLERAWIYPTLEINGIMGGYGGSGFKTVIPAKATAKISCRLVPQQDPHRTELLVKKFLEANVPEGITATITSHPGIGKAMRTSPSSKIVQAASQAYEEVFGSPCHYILEGGSIPIVPELAQTSSSEAVLMGMTLPGDNAHAPNERFSLNRFKQGLAVITRIIDLLGTTSKF